MISISVGKLRDLICEALGALKLLDTATMNLVLRKGMKIEEIITDIRVIKGVATVTQSEPIIRTPGGRRLLTAIVTFDPKDMNKLDYIDSMARQVKQTKDVITIVVKTLNGKPVRDATGKRKLVY